MSEAAQRIPEMLTNTLRPLNQSDVQTSDWTGLYRLSSSNFDLHIFDANPLVPFRTFFMLVGKDRVGVLYFIVQVSLTPELMPCQRPVSWFWLLPAPGPQRWEYIEFLRMMESLSERKRSYLCSFPYQRLTQVLRSFLWFVIKHLPLYFRWWRAPSLASKCGKLWSVCSKGKWPIR